MTHLHVVPIGLVGLQHRELGVVRGVSSLVTEVPADFEDSSSSANHEPLEVELRGNAQVKVQIVSVDVGAERPGIRATMDRLQNRGLDLNVIVTQQDFSHRTNGVRASPQLITSARVDNEIEVTLPNLRLRVVESRPPRRQWSQGLRRQSPRRRLQTQRSIAGSPHGPGCHEVVSQRHRMPEFPKPVGSQRVTLHHQLAGPGPVEQIDEDDTAVIAAGTDPPGDRHLLTGQLDDDVARTVIGLAVGRVCLHPGLEEPLARGHPGTNLLREPPLKKSGSAFLSQKFRDLGVTANRVNRLGRRLHRVDPTRNVELALGNTHRQTDLRQVRSIGEVEVAGLPARLVLDVGAVELLDLEPLRRNEHKPAVETTHRGSTDAGTLLDRLAKDREVHRHAPDTNLRSGSHETGDHELGDSVVGSVQVTTHDVQGQSVIAPRGEGENSCRLASTRTIVGVQRLHHDASPVERVSQTGKSH